MSLDKILRKFVEIQWDLARYGEIWPDLESNVEISEEILLPVLKRFD